MVYIISIISYITDYIYPYIWYGLYHIGVGIPTPPYRQIIRLDISIRIVILVRIYTKVYNLIYLIILIILYNIYNP